MLQLQLGCVVAYPTQDEAVRHKRTCTHQDTYTYTYTSRMLLHRCTCGMYAQTEGHAHVCATRLPV